MSALTTAFLRSLSPLDLAALGTKITGSSRPYRHLVADLTTTADLARIARRLA